jgi:hypothetical protein
MKRDAKLNAFYPLATAFLHILGQNEFSQFSPFAATFKSEFLLLAHKYGNPILVSALKWLKSQKLHF